VTIANVVRRLRTPAEPGPGTISDASLQALDIVIGRRLHGLLAGDFRSPFAGVGTELYQVRPYVPGDDVRRLEWNVTARTGEPHIRVELEDRRAVTWVLVDTSASMGFGSTERRKMDVAEGVAIAIGHVATRRANRLGLVSFGGSKPHVVPPRQGRSGLLAALDSLRQSPGGDGGIETALQIVSGIAARRSLLVIVSDFRGAIDWRLPLLRLAPFHRILAVEIRDPREQSLPDIGELRLEDPETGDQVLVDTGDPALRESFAEAAAAERRELAQTLVSCGVRHVVLSTDGDWLVGLAEFLRRNDRI
jgi:uncharacterized protein (DUF58 family)